MNDDTAALCSHRRHQFTIEANGRHQVEVELLAPYLIGERLVPSCRGGRAAQHVHDDVDPAQALSDGLCQLRAALRRREIHADEHFDRQIFRLRPGAGQDPGAQFAEKLDGCGACATRAGRHERPLAFEADERVHGVISNSPILSPSRRKK